MTRKVPVGDRKKKLKHVVATRAVTIATQRPLLVATRRMTRRNESDTVVALATGTYRR
ncbi:MAG TPA: hypothetical protein VEK15_21510 [Vicinamibacteria bacterium]|nr:hypothetical protein [Vicinamibacteria bacterium]